MTSILMKSAVAVAATLIATGCIASEERTGSGADGVPQVVAVCAEGHPDCQDTVVTNDDQTGGGLPSAPSTDEDDAIQSGGFVVGNGLSIDDAVAYEGTEVVAVHGYVVITAQTALLCETLAESFPPQCGGLNLAITNPQTLGDIALIEEGDVQWSTDVVVLLGHISGTDFTIDSTVAG